MNQILKALISQIERSYDANQYFYKLKQCQKNHWILKWIV